MPTTRDVANCANVSTATVSNVLNNTKYVSPEIRDRVMAAAKELQYLSKGTEAWKKKSEVVFAVYDVCNPHCGMVLDGLNEVAAANSMAVSLMKIWADKEAFCKMLIEQKVLAVCQYELPESNLETLRNAGIIIESSWHGLVIDFDSIYDKAIKHLADLGHRRIVFLRGLSEKDSSNVRLASFEKAIQRYGLENDPTLIVNGIYPYETTSQSGYWATKARLKQKQDFTAVIALNDLMAIGAMSAIQEKGLSIPGDISVLGCDDIDLSAFVHPSLSTIRLPAGEIGKRTMYNIIQTMYGEKTQSVNLELQLIIRNSIGRAS